MLQYQPVVFRRGADNVQSINATLEKGLADKSTTHICAN